MSVHVDDHGLDLRIIWEAPATARGSGAASTADEDQRQPVGAVLRPARERARNWLVFSCTDGALHSPRRLARCGALGFFAKSEKPIARYRESPHNDAMGMQQLDLFAAGGVRPTAVADGWHREPVHVAELSDAELIESIPSAGLSNCIALTEEAAHRGLRAAVPALEALCRRFRGFGLHRAVPEQISSLQALAAIGGTDAAAAVRRLIATQVVQGPGLCEAVRAAASLRCRLPEDVAVVVLRHADPEVRAPACRCVPNTRRVVDVLLQLLGDLHEPVAMAAACTLGRIGRAEALPALLQSLRRAPCAEVIEAVARLADEEVVVLLGRIARSHATLREAALAALEDIDTPLSATVLTGVKAGRS